MIDKTITFSLEQIGVFIGGITVVFFSAFIFIFKVFPSLFKHSEKTGSRSTRVNGYNGYMEQRKKEALQINSLEIKQKSLEKDVVEIKGMINKLDSKVNDLINKMIEWIVEDK